jgi:hypothetical protein
MINRKYMLLIWVSVFHGKAKSIPLRNVYTDLTWPPCIFIAIFCKGW